MVKCVVSSCLNREQLTADRSFSRAPKRFFSFPKDPARIKVWLAALREPDKQDWAENHVICEDHFLPEDISDSGVSSDAIPIMPPCLEEDLGINAWPEDPEEDTGWAMGDENEDEDFNEGQADEDEANEYGNEQMNEDTNDVAEEDANNAVEEDANDEAEEDANDVAEEDANDEVEEDANNDADEDDNEELLDDVIDRNKEEEEEMPATDDTQTVTEESTEAADGTTAPPAVTQKPSPAPAPSSCEPKKNLREDVSLRKLTRRFLEMLLNGDGSLDVRSAAKMLQAPKRRVYDVTNILMGINMVRKESINRVRWMGKCPISSFLWEKQRMQQEAEKLKQVEDTLDGLIKSCAQQLFSMTDDRNNANAAFVTFADVLNLPAFRDQTVIVVKAPEETKLEVPAPKKDSIQIQLKSGSGPISVLTCDTWLDTSGKILQAFRQIQHSHIRTRLLQTESSSSQSTVLSA